MRASHVQSETAPGVTLTASADAIAFARGVLQNEGEAVLRLAENLGAEFCWAADLLLQCRGAIMVSGIGKAGWIGQKVAATLASTGARSYFLHPAEAVHGDLGRVHRDDVAVIFSASGETEEVLRLLPALGELETPIIAITGNLKSTLARAAVVALDLGVTSEACSLGLAPSTSTTAMLALGDALALLVSRQRGFTPADFARVHPAGNLGRRLAKVEDVMRPLADCRLAEQTRTVRETLISLGRPGRRTGAIMLVDSLGRLTGLFTDSDLARLLERQQDAALDRPLAEVMTPSPMAVSCGQRMTEAVKLLADRKISELPVIDAQGKPVGLIDVTDVVGWLPRTGDKESTRPVSMPRMSRRQPRAEQIDEAITLPFPACDSIQQFHRLE